MIAKQWITELRRSNQRKSNERLFMILSYDDIKKIAICSHYQLLLIIYLFRQQGDLDRQRLLGDRPRMVYESVLDDGLEGIEHQERYVSFFCSIDSLLPSFDDLPYSAVFYCLVELIVCRHIRLLYTLLLRSIY